MWYFSIMWVASISLAAFELQYEWMTNIWNMLAKQ